MPQQNLIQSIQKLTPIIAGMRPEQVYTSSRMQAIQEAIIALARGDNISRGPGILLDRSPGRVRIKRLNETLNLQWVRDALASLQSQITSEATTRLEADIAVGAAAAAALAAAVATIEGEIAGVAATAAGAAATAGSALTLATANAALIVTLQGQVATLITTVAAHQATLEDHEDRITDLESRMDAIEDRVTTLEARVTTDEDRITALETWRTLLSTKFVVGAAPGSADDTFDGVTFSLGTGVPDRDLKSANVRFCEDGTPVTKRIMTFPPTS